MAENNDSGEDEVDRDENNEPEENNSQPEESPKRGGLKQAAREFAKQGKENVKKAAKDQMKKVATSILKALSKLIFSKVGLIILVILIVVGAAAYLIYKYESKKTFSIANEHFSTLQADGTLTKAGEKFKATASMIYATDADIAEIQKQFMQDIENKNASVYAALNTKYKNGDTANSESNSLIADINDKRTLYEHILRSEKYNFNRINWRAFKRSDMLSGGTNATGTMTMKVDAETGLKYPEYVGGTGLTDELGFYVDKVYPYLQSWIIPLAIGTGTTSGGLSGSTAEEDPSNITSRNTRFAYEIMASAYHKINFDRFELYERTIKEQFRTYEKERIKGVVTNTCKFYDRYYKSNILGIKTTVNTSGWTEQEIEDAFDSGVITGQQGRLICNDSDPVYEATPQVIEKVLELPKTNKYNALVSEYSAYMSRSSVDNYLKSDPDFDYASYTVNRVDGLNINNGPNTSAYSYDVTDMQMFDQATKKTYALEPYSLGHAVLQESMSESPYSESKVYVGNPTDVLNTIYVKQTEDLSWKNDPGVTSTTYTTTKNVTKENKNGNNAELTRKWQDSLRIDSVDTTLYTILDLMSFAGANSLNHIEQEIYLELERKNEINRVDFINAKPEIYQKYLKTRENKSKYIGYTREQLVFSYSILKDLIKELVEDYGVRFMWGTSLVPFSTMSVIGEGTDVESLNVLGLDVIFPVTIADMAHVTVSDTQISPGVYGYGGHTGIDLPCPSSKGDQSRCTDAIYQGTDSDGRSNMRKCPFIKGPKIYTVMEGKINKVTYSEHNKYYMTGNTARIYTEDTGSLDITYGSGCSVTIEHADGTKANYNHLYPDLPFLRQLASRVGETVPIGTFIGFMGNSGNSSGMHLHFEVRKYFVYTTKWKFKFGNLKTRKGEYDGSRDLDKKHNVIYDNI